MPRLHYGDRRFQIAEDVAATVIQSIAARASKATPGWVSFTDERDQPWSILVSPGVPIYVAGDCDVAAERAARLIS